MLKKVIIGLIIIGAIFLLLNADFIAKNLRHSVFRRYPQDPTTQFNDTQPKAEANTLWIQSLDIQAPVVYVEEVNEAGFQEALRRGVVHYPGTALPGQFGNVYIFGHSSDYPWAKGDYKTIFALLPRIQSGHEIKLSDPDGNLYTYAVTQTFVAEPSDTHLLSQYNNEKKLLTLQTSYPLGTALRRYIVVAELKQ